MADACQSITWLDDDIDVQNNRKRIMHGPEDRSRIVMIENIDNAQGP
jgi:hypothetical protein